MATQFNDRVALVTGGGSGIGQAAALAFAREGARVVVADINEDLGAATERMIDRSGGDATFIRCDVSRQGDVEALIKGVVKQYGRLDMAFNNAGVAPAMAHVSDYDEDEWDRVMNINLRGTFLCMKYELAQMLAQDHPAAIVNNASILGMVGFDSSAAYVAAKHGVIGLTRTAAIEYGAKQIRVNAVCPGFIDTPMLSNSGITKGSEMRAQIEALHPQRRLGRAEEVAEAVVWLASSAASFVNGAALSIDGGFTAQ